MSTIRDALTPLVTAGTVTELRALQTVRGTVSGYFDNVEALACAAAAWDGRAEGVCMTLNPVRPDLLARARNRVREYARHTTSNEDIIARRWLLIDCDALRPSGISATDAEHDHAVARAREIREGLIADGWPAAALGLADSGNGGHVLARIDLPNDTSSRILLERVLHALAFRFDDAAVHVDRTTANAARLVKIYGTQARKGDATEERPHRRTAWLVPPGDAVVAHASLEALAWTASPEPSRAPDRGSGSPFDLEAWLTHHPELVVARSGPWNGGYRWTINPCPWNPAHTNGAAFIVRFPSGALAAGCHHNACSGKGWHELRDLLEPGWRERAHARARRNGAPPPRDHGGPRGDDAGARNPGEGPRAADPHASSAQGRWAAACSAPEFVNAAEPEANFLVTNVLAQGSATMVMSPRGLGKTHVAYAWAVRLARAGTRVLLLDRDNSRREIRRRLRAWGAGGSNTATLMIMTRDDVPPLTDTTAWTTFPFGDYDLVIVDSLDASTDTTAWTTFPFGDYDLVIVDSLDASTEGVGEKDSAKPSRALGPLLDIAHRADGPAILVLGNTVKSAEHSRGSGVIEDRADIVFEVRDATELAPTGLKPWWQELPPAGVGAWAERAARRIRREQYRLAFVPSKFRVGEEPNPFIVEIELAGEPWSLRDVTAEVVEASAAAAGHAAEKQSRRREAGAKTLASEVKRRADAGDPMLAEKDAVPFLVQAGLKRDDARRLLRGFEGRFWNTVPLQRQGRPKVLCPISEATGDDPANDAAERNSEPKRPRQSDLFRNQASADGADSSGGDGVASRPASTGGCSGDSCRRARESRPRGKQDGGSPSGAWASETGDGFRGAAPDKGVTVEDVVAVFTGAEVCGEGPAVWAPLGASLVRPSDAYHCGPTAPTESCRVCGTLAWWHQPTGAWVCGVCHPDPRSLAGTDTGVSRTTPPGTGSAGDGRSV